MTDKIQKAPPASEVLPDDRPGVEVGQWYWVKEDRDRWFGCVVHVGSNYAELHGLGRDSHYVARVHFDEFWERCEKEPDPDGVIDRNVARCRGEVDRLLDRVKELTARLGVGHRAELASGSETQALVRVTSDQPVEEYKAALIRAQKEELPDLFKKIRDANEDLAEWMSARVVPMKARAKDLEGAIGSIEERIFSVELYAGLVEQVTRVRDGEPAPIGEKIRLMQRRHYMDEECLANYEAGGMEFKNIGGFDRWLARKDNLDRILPFPRCVVAFRVRRNRKEREMVDLSDYFRIADEEKADRTTFLYLRNGGRLYRLRTGIEFDEKLFPDMDGSKLTGKLYGRKFAARVDELITENEYLSMLEEHEREVAEWKKRKKAYDAAIRSPEARAKAKEKGLKKPDDSCVDATWPGFQPFDHTLRDYHPFDRSSVYYDDIMKKVQDDIRAHNRIGLILQGLLDRSPVFHPHPPWQIWTDAGFRQALELVYDESRALTAGEKPDFEAYRARLNASLKEGSVTVGQEDSWELAEGEKESRRLDRDWRTRTSYRPERFRPYGDPGPGKIARVARYQPVARRCTFEWERERQTRRDDGPEGPVRVTFTVDASRILNVDAYVPGDFKQFFNDPRTRAEYLRWAPLLLEAEEYHAGNRKAKPLLKKPGSAPRTSYAGARRYRMRKARKSLVGKAVRLVRSIETRGGTVYEKGTLWRVSSGHGYEFDIVGITGDGKTEKNEGGYVARIVHSVRHVDGHAAFEVDPSVPAEKKEEE